MIMRKNFLFLICKLLVSGCLLFLLYRKTPLEEIGALFGKINFGLLVVVLFILLGNTVLSALKWRILLLSDSLDIPLRKLVVSYLIGGFFNIFLPSNIGGDSYRIYDLMRKSNQTVRSAASVFADRLTGFIALVCLSLISSVIVAWKLGIPSFILIPSSILALLLGALYALWKKTSVRFLLKITRLDRFPAILRIVEKFFITFARYGADYRTISLVMLISFIFQLLVIVAVYLMALSLHVTVPFFYFSAFVPLITLMEAIPVSIYGIGIRDAGYVYFFGWAGMADVHTRSLALLFLAITVCYSLIGGLLYLARLVISYKEKTQSGS